MSRIFVTGAGGFLGRHILQSPAGSGLTFFRATRAEASDDPFEVPLGPAPWTRETFSSAIVATRPDVVLHLAGQTHSANIRACFEANLITSAELLAAVEGLPSPPAVVLIGSAAEYGFVPQALQPVNERHPCSPVTDYAIAKFSQTLLGLRAAAGGKRVLVVRMFNPVGMGMPRHLALPSFAYQLGGVRDHQVTLKVGNLDVSRDFLEAQEAARLLLQLATLPEWPWPLVNLCSGRACTLRTLLEALVKLSGLEVVLRTDPKLVRTGEMKELTGDVSRLREVGLIPAAPDFAALLPALLNEARRRHQSEFAAP